MRSLLRSPSFALCSLALAACGDDAAAPAADTAAADTAVATDPADATGETSPDATDPDASTCESTAAGTIGAGGLTLAVCGATLTVPAAALAAGAEVSLAAVTPPAGPPFEMELIGPVVEVSAASDFAVPVTLELADASAAEGYRHALRYEPGVLPWLEQAACRFEGGLRLEVTAPYDFVLARETVAFPESPEGLGSGTLETRLGGAAAIDWSVADGSATFDKRASGLRTARVALRHGREDGSELTLELALDELADHSFVPLSIAVRDSRDAAASASWDAGVDADPSAVSLIGLAGDRIVGSFTVEAKGDGGAAALTVAVDVATVHWHGSPTTRCPAAR